MRLALPLLIVASAAGQQVAAPVVYSRDVAPILAMHCSSCHSPDGWHREFFEGFDASTYAGLRKGGKSGPAIVPGKPASSLLIAKLSPPDAGDTGVLMPLFGKPLSRAEQDTIRRWIAEGATQDDLPPTTYTFGIEGVPGPPRSDLREAYGYLKVDCRLLTQGYMDLNILEPGSGKVLVHRQAAMKWRKDWADISAPGGWAAWSIDWGKTWPDKVDVQLTVSQTEEPPYGTFFAVIPRTGVGLNLQANDLIPQPLRLGVDPAGIFRFWLESNADLDITITALHPKRLVFHDDSQRALPHGQGYYKWPLRNAQNRAVQPGDYAACLRFKPLNGGSEYPIAVYFAVK